MTKQYQYNTSAKGRLVYDGAKPLFIDFNVADPTKTYQKGQQVYLSAADTVDFTTTGKVPLGFVAVANDPNDPNNDSETINRVTVRTNGADVTQGYANLAIPTAGVLLEAVGVHVGDETYTDYVPALAGKYACAISLGTALINTKLDVLLLLSPTLA